MRDVVSRAAPFLDAETILVSTTQGIEIDPGARMDEVLRECRAEEHHARLVFLSGPSFAREIADGKPTSVTREIADGKPTSVTREIADGKPTSVTLACADLLLTCTADLSRKRHVGLELGRGRKLAEILAETTHGAEGVRTAHTACRLADTLDVDVPIMRMTCAILDGEIRRRDRAGRGGPRPDDPPARQRARLRRVSPRGCARLARVGERVRRGARSGRSLPGDR